MNISELNNFFLGKWYNSGDKDLPLCKCFSPDQKRSREEFLRLKLRKFSSLKSKIRDENIQNKLFRSAQKASGLLLNTKEEDLRIVFSDEFRDCSKAFVYASKKFDSSISKNDISQAARNLWVINCIQVLFGFPVKMTPSAFAYSLLYPYCDNYIDDPSIPNESKCSFNSGLGLRLKGESIRPVNNYEEKIFSLLSMIENEFPRKKFPEVYKSLIYIHDAQCRSLQLLKKNHLSEKQILEFSFEKGGTSVLADGFLVCGTLSETQSRFLYGLGIYLQIIDDLQDVKEDSDAELSTIFSKTAVVDNLDQLTNRTLNFGTEIIKYAREFNNGDSFKRLITESTNLLVIEAACMSHKSYSKNYIEQLEKFSPFHFTFLRKYRKKYSSVRIPFEEMLSAVPISY